MDAAFCQKTRHMSFGPIDPAGKPTSPVDIPGPPEVNCDNWDIFIDAPDRGPNPVAALPDFDEAMAQHTRRFCSTQNITSIVAAQSVSHHIAGNAFAAMAQRNGIGMIAQQLHETNRQTSREIVFQHVVGSARARPQTSIDTGVIVGSMTSVNEGAALARLSTGRSSVASCVEYSDLETLEPGNDTEDSVTDTFFEADADRNSIADLRMVLSSSPLSRTSSSEWDTTAANSPLPTHGYRPFGIGSQTEAIRNAFPVSPGENEFSRPHVGLRELTRLSMIAELDRATASREGEDDCIPPPELLTELSPPRAHSPKPLSIRQRQEVVRTRMQSSLGQREERQPEVAGGFAEGLAHARLLQQSRQRKTEKRGWWCRIKSWFMWGKKEPK